MVAPSVPLHCAYGGTRLGSEVGRSLCVLVVSKILFYFLPRSQNQPKRYYLRSPRRTGPQTGLNASAFVAVIEFGCRAFCPKRPPRLGKSTFCVFGLFRVPDSREIYSSAPAPPKTSKSRIAAAGGRTIESRPTEDESYADALQLQRAPTGPAAPRRHQIMAETARNGTC